MAFLDDDSWNRHLESWARPTLGLRRRTCSAFRVCGCVGLVLAIGSGTALTMLRGLSLGLFGVIVLAAVGTFLGLAMLTKVVSGQERLTYYHHEVAILIVVALLLVALGEPVLAYLDVTILGLGAFLVSGRVGCFMVGCCHGRPSRRGVRYSRDHAGSGVSPHLVGVRVFPIQLVESLWVLLTVAVGFGVVASRTPAGIATAWFVAAYGAGRFVLELGRGDAARRVVWVLSEAQWTSLLLLVATIVAGVAGVFQVQPWHVAALTTVVLALLGVVIRRSTDGTARHRLVGAHHIREMAGAVELLTTLARNAPLLGQTDSRAGAVDIACTSEGIQLSSGRVVTPEGAVRHFTLSSARGTLGEAAGRQLADLLILLAGDGWRSELVPGRPGVFHLLLRE